MDSELNLKRKRYKELRALLQGADRDNWRSIEKTHSTSNTLEVPLTPDAWLLELELFVEDSLRSNFYKHLDAWTKYKQNKLHLTPTQNSFFVREFHNSQLKRDFLYEINFNFWPLSK